MAVPTTASLPATTAACPTPTVDLKILVIAGDGTEADLRAITQTLTYLGTPFTVWLAAPRPASQTTDRLVSQLAAGSHGFYQGVILTTGNLAYFDATAKTYLSALTSTEWQTLWSYEACFGVRQVTWYTFPTVDYGFQAPTAARDTTASPIAATLTSAGQSVFPYLNALQSLVITNAYAYLARPTDPATTTLLTDAQGDALAALRSYPNGRQNLALTFDSNPNLIHTMAVAYGLVNWVTQGIFLGERHVYLEAQVDDLFIDDADWAASTPCGTPVDATGATYRMTGADLQIALLWQQDKQAQPNTAGLGFEFPFNGIGTVRFPQDTLVPTVNQLQNQFNWVSHTYDHTNLETVNYATAQSEINQNNAVAASFPLTTYSPLNLVTPDVSGLSNGEFLRAAFDAGVRYLVSDASRVGQSNPSPNAGIYNPLQPAILAIPRHATNLFFNVSAPDGWVTEYNCNYRTFWGRNLTYAEILDKESQVMLSYLLKGDIDPLMFHQSNLRAYDGIHSLLSDLQDRTLQKYNDLFALPIISVTMDEAGRRMAARMEYNAAGVTASIVPGQSITITAQQAATVPVTGLNAAGAEVYGGQPISRVALSAGQSVTLPLLP